MFGALSGAVGAANGPQSGSESRISSSILPLNSVAIAGLTLVVDLQDSGCRVHRCAELSANITITNSHAAAHRCTPAVGSAHGDSSSAETAHAATRYRC